MKKYVQILLVLVAMIICLPDAKAQANEFTVPLSDPAKRGKLKAHLNSGSITVKGTARKDVLIRYSMIEDDHEHDEDDDHDDEEHDHDRDKDKPSKAGMKKIGGGGIDLEVTENANFVKAESGSWNQPIKLEIEIPSGFDV